MLNLTEAAAPAAVTDLPVRELERRVLTSARPCIDRLDDWFPDDEPDGRQTRAHAAFEARAEALCRFCPVRAECLEKTLIQEGPRQGFGIAGGLAPWTRQAIKAQRAQRAQDGAR
jgi:hypothetical protein